MRLMERVGTNVKGLRRRRGWTQQALAARIRTSQVYVAQVEGAVKELSLEMLGRFAQALRVKPGRLFDRDRTGTEEEPMTTTERKAGTIIDLAQARQARERGKSRPTPAPNERPTRASSQLKTTLQQSYEAAEALALAIEEHEQVLRDMGAGQDR